MTLGDFIREYRKEHGLSQRQFALVCGLSNGYISALELGINRKTGKPITPMLAQLKKLADGMNLTIMDLFEQVDDMPVDITTEATSLAEKSASLLESEGGRVDPIDLEIAMRILRLSPEKKKEAAKYLRYLEDRADD